MAIRESRRILYRSSDTIQKTFATRARQEPTRSLSCALCGSARTGREWRAQGVVFKRCSSCGLWRQDPQPLAQAVVARYDDEYLHYETARHLEYRDISLKSLAEAGLTPSGYVTAEGRTRSVLELGCATGALLSVFAEAGWAAKGIEVGPSMAAYARQCFGLDIYEGIIENACLPAGHYDAIVATHVIEHLNDPRSFLAEARRAIRADGRLYLITPNAGGFQPGLMGARWRSVIRDHLYLFSRKTLGAMVSSEGFCVEYEGSWGGWPAGMKPGFLKKPLDQMAKRYGLGDVMIMSARPDTRQRRTA